MPRQPRIEFPGAIYHVLARGNRRAEIFSDDRDRARFLKSLGDTCVRLGWEVRAWVLMGNHYHLALHTPEANLVDGMKWLQNAYTRYFNTRHQLWGRLFGDRYKSVLVDPQGDYQKRLIDYIHLNPARAGIVGARGAGGLLGYPHSSLVAGFASPPSKRAPWLDVGTGLRLAGLKDSASGRRRYVGGLERRIAEEEAARLGLEEVGGQSLHSTMRRGWYWGSQAFREKLTKLVPPEKAAANPTYRSSPLGRDERSERAEVVALEAIGELGLECDGQGRPVFGYGDVRRGAAAWIVWHRSGAPQAWIAERLGLRSAANVSQQRRRFDNTRDAELPPDVMRWRKAWRKSGFFD